MGTLECLRCHENPSMDDSFQVCRPCREGLDPDEIAYYKMKKLYLQWAVDNDKQCPVTGAGITMNSDIHHKKGRVGYADEQAKKEGITLLIDIRYWMAVSRKGHDYIETHPTEALANEWSLSRKDIIT